MEWNNELTLSGGYVAVSDRAQGSIFFVGNATVILRYAGQPLGGDCGPLGDSCGHPELSWSDADQALELAGKLALVREVGMRGDPLNQSRLQEDVQLPRYQPLQIR